MEADRFSHFRIPARNHKPTSTHVCARLFAWEGRHTISRWTCTCICKWTCSASPIPAFVHSALSPRFLPSLIHVLRHRSPAYPPTYTLAFPFLHTPQFFPFRQQSAQSRSGVLAPMPLRRRSRSPRWIQTPRAERRSKRGRMSPQPWACTCASRSRQDSLRPEDRSGNRTSARS